MDGGSLTGKEGEAGGDMRKLIKNRNFNFSLEEIKPYCCIDNKTFPIMKFDFYRNGKISKIYKPKNLKDQLRDRISALQY